MLIVEHQHPGNDVWTLDLPEFARVTSVALLNGRLTAFVLLDEHQGELERHLLRVVPSNVSFPYSVNARFLGTVVIGTVAFHVYYLGKQ